MMKSNSLRRSLHGSIFQYDTGRFPFKEELEQLYGCDLSMLHQHLGAFDTFKRSNDQTTLAHKVFYANFDRSIKPLYFKFIKEFVASILAPHEFYYQLIPTFRIGLPGNKFVGEFHKDSEYNHQSYEINFNLGICNYIGEAALKTESKPGTGEYITLECPYGSVFSFDHIDCNHGSDPNLTNNTMVSFDFRLALKDLYYESDSHSVNMFTKFRPGSYFSEQSISSGY